MSFPFLRAFLKPVLPDAPERPRFSGGEDALDIREVSVGPERHPVQQAFFAQNALGEDAVGVLCGTYVGMTVPDIED